MTLRKSSKRAAIGTLSLLLWGSVHSHHSTAIYDSDNPIELAGTVVEWQFVNPHNIIVLEVVDPSGAIVVWSLEGGNTAGLIRRGWTPETLKAGDEIIATVRPLRSGAPGGNYSNVRWADGRAIDPRGSGPPGR